MQQCSHEEADSSFLSPVLDVSSNEFRKVSIVTVDTDVVIIALYRFFSLQPEELSVEIYAALHRR